MTAGIVSSLLRSSPASGTGSESEYALNVWKLNFGAGLLTAIIGTGSATARYPWSLNFGADLAAVATASSTTVSGVAWLKEKQVLYIFAEVLKLGVAKFQKGLPEFEVLNFFYLIKETQSVDLQIMFLHLDGQNIT